MHVNGISYDSNGNKEYEGDFEKGEYHGKDIKYNIINDRKVYEGDFKKGEYHGKGIKYNTMVKGIMYYDSKPLGVYVL